MSLSYAFLRDHVDVQLLVLAQQHHFNRVLFLSLCVSILDWNDWVVWIDRNDVLGGDLKLVAVLADVEKFEVY